MLITKILKTLSVFLGVGFMILQGLTMEVEGAGTSALALVILTYLYCRYTKSKTKHFFWFLLTFTFAHLLSYSAYFASPNNDLELEVFYYVTNIMYITAYIFLIVRIASGLNLKSVFSEFAIPILILVVLDIFCVTLVTATTEDVLTIYEYSLEFIYNGVIMTLLSLALVNYMHRNDNKSMLFLISSICIVFSEIIQLAYYYILDNNSYLGFTYSFFLVLAFVFLYLQSQLEFTGPEAAYSEDRLEV